MTSPRGSQAAAGDDVRAVSAAGTDPAEATVAGTTGPASAANLTGDGAAGDGATGTVSPPDAGSVGSPVAKAQAGQTQTGQAQAADTGSRAAEPETPAAAPPGEPDRPADKPRPWCPDRRAVTSLARCGLAGYRLSLAFLISFWGITGPSFWRDEAATIAAIKRPLGDLIKMLGNVDAVHGAYYLMMWPIEHVLGSGALVLRLPSASRSPSAPRSSPPGPSPDLAVGWPRRRADLRRAAGHSRYGQEARSYAMVMTVAAISSYLLVRVLAAEQPRQRRWLAGYGASIAVLGILNIFGLLLVPAHAVTMAVYCRRGLREPAPRRLAIGWLTAVAAGVVVASPLLVLGYLQRGQIAWLVGQHIVVRTRHAVLAERLVSGDHDPADRDSGRARAQHGDAARKSAWRNGRGGWRS